MYFFINEHPAWTQEDVRLISDTVIFIHRKLLPPATKLRQGNVFTSVCDSVHRGSLSRRGLCPGGVSVQGGQGSLSEGGLCPWGLCPRGVPVQGGLCPERGSLSRESLSMGGLCQGDPHMVTCGQYASYWNAFLLM